MYASIDCVHSYISPITGDGKLYAFIDCVVFVKYIEYCGLRGVCSGMMCGIVGNKVFNRVCGGGMNSILCGYDIALCVVLGGECMNNKYRICMALIVVLAFGIGALCSLYVMVDMYYDSIEKVHQIEKNYSDLEVYYETFE